MTENGAILSPRLKRLQQKLEAGKPETLSSFWQEVKRQGAPLVEPITGDDQQRLVTFLWRASGDLTSVALISLMTDPTKFYLTHMPDTDIWYLSLQLPASLRATYQFYPEDRSASAQEGENNPLASYLHDPLNPNLFPFYTEEEDPTGIKFARSVLELPDASPQPWTKPQAKVAKGKVQLLTLRSDILGNERRVWIYTPANYKPGNDTPYPLLMLFDGWGYAYLMPTFTILDNLIAAGEIPPTVAVLPDSLDEEVRFKELVFYKPFNDFLVTECLPWVLARYAITTDPRQTVVGGSSAGGLAAAYAALEHPEVFGSVLSQSGAVSLAPAWETDYGWLSRQYALREKSELRFHLDVGTLEANSYRQVKGRPSTLEGNRHLRDALLKRDYPVHYCEFSGGHDYISWQGTLGDGLKYLLE